MIISIDKDKLIEPLRHVVGVSEKKQTMPILGNILFRTDGQGLLMVSSDLEVEISTRIEYQTEETLECITFLMEDRIKFIGRILLSACGYICRTVREDQN